MELGFARQTLLRLPLAEATLTLWRWATDAPVLEDLFDRQRGGCYQRLLSFSTLVSLVGDALIQHGGSGRKSFQHQRAQGQLTVSDPAAYQKLGRLPVAVSEAFLAETTARLAAVLPTPSAVVLPPSLRSLRPIVVDGQTIKRVPKRLKPLRGSRRGILGGKALVALDLHDGLAVALATHPDGDTNDAKLVPALLPQVRQHRPGAVLLWVADRQFGDLRQTAAFVEGGHHFWVRYSKKTGFHADPQRPARTGVDDQGRVYTEEWGWLGRASARQRRYVRRLTLQRPGDEDVVLVTDLLDSDAYPAVELLALYRMRWGIERVFQQITEVFQLQRLIGTTPQGTLFQLAFCLLLYNVIQVIRGYVAEAAQRPPETISTELLFDDVRRQLIAVEEVVGIASFAALAAALPPEAVQQRLRELLANVWQKRWLKAPSRPRRGRAPRRERNHASAYRLLNAHPRDQEKKTDGLGT